MTFRYFKIFVFLLGLTPNLFAQTNPFAGQWINEKYYNALMKTKSPMKAFANYFQSNIVFTKQLKGGQLLGWNFHEGEETVLKPVGNGYELWRTEPKEKIGAITVIEQDKKIKVGKESFVKIKSTDPMICLEEVLFEGNYQLNGKPVKFNANGTVTGLPNIKYFFPKCDFIEKILPFDLIVLNKVKDTMTGQSYIYEFKDDSLIIYNIDCQEVDSESKDCLKGKKGQEKYILKRI
ncbi:hypothetical protein [Flectobacillus longus]|uniref:hypothetical protein n=1 Tax=Flectobacillus longus TaxID=2984207 RepID=UPI0024B68F52|nr:hypothetical protein [Flectobacillus longus]MDI9878458.1 hypothetical protein [Flectobacillus longus]